MRIVLLFLVLLLAPAFADAQAAQSVVCRTDMPLQTAEWLQYEDPAAAGWSAAALEDARAHATAIGSTAVMVLYRGRVLLAWGDIDVRHNIHSIRKSLLGALVGIAVEEGNIRPSATLAELGIDDSPPLTAQERTARVVHLLQARSGVYHPAAYETADMEQFRPERDSHAPGTHWFYNNWDFNTLATIYRNATGEDLFEAFERRMARPLGMQDFRLEDTRYVHDKSKSVHPAYLFSLSARDLARFGQLWLRDGCWNGRAVVPSAWVRASVTSYSKAFDGGYGYASWWTYPAWFGAEYGYDRLRSHDSWMTTGTGGQLIWVVPDLDLVFVHLHERSASSRVGAPAYWILLDRILAARTGRTVVADPAFGPVRSRPLR